MRRCWRRMAGKIFQGAWASRPPRSQKNVGETPTLLVKNSSPASLRTTTSAPPKKSAASSAGSARITNVVAIIGRHNPSKSKSTSAPRPPPHQKSTINIHQSTFINQHSSISNRSGCLRGCLKNHDWQGPSLRAVRENGQRMVDHGVIAKALYGRDHSPTILRTVEDNRPCHFSDSL